jgi:altronate hydrolase
MIRIHQQDNVAVAITDLRAGETHAIDMVGVTLRQDIPRGHKVALLPIQQGELVSKYGFPIGRATCDIQPGEWVHSHNLKTHLAGLDEYIYKPVITPFIPFEDNLTFGGFVRDNGDIGIRNEIWIIPTVGCVNKTAEILARTMEAKLDDSAIDGVYAFPHPYGCSQLGDDHVRTQKILAGLVKHPNAAGVLVLGLGCENNTMEDFRKVLGDVDSQQVRFLVAQEQDDEIEAGIRELRALAAYARQFRRTSVPISCLKVGLKCGASDGFSGITANPLVGALSDLLVAHGGTTVLTEVPEMFGAETLLLNRCTTREVFDKCVNMVNGFKAYYLSHEQPIYENPSPGNKAGGITTLEEKSLGCVQKGGTSPVIDVLDYGEPLQTNGLNLLTGPGNDPVSITALTAAGAHLILFTTGRGNPLGAPVPTIKISSNTPLAKRKPHWIDFDAGRLLDGASIPDLADDLFRAVLKVASGNMLTRNEQNNYREIAIFKDGVTL